MELYRLDATHDAGDGEFAKFFVDRESACAADDRFARCGWLYDYYAVEIVAPAPILQRLLDGVWPNESDEDLVELATTIGVRDHVREAEHKLERITQRRRKAR